MNDDNFLKDLLFKLTPKNIGDNLLIYSNLYLKPLQAWKKSLTEGRSSYNFIILHLIYYTIFIYLIIKDIKTAIPITILEVIITSVPFIIFFSPFILYNKIFSAGIKLINFYRFLLILKLQFIPIFVILFMLAKWSEVDILYVIVENFTYLIWILFIIILPLIIKLKFWKKILWILSNYLLFLLFIILISLIFNNQSDFNPLVKKMIIPSPNGEYINFKLESSNSSFEINDKYCLVLIKFNESGELSRFDVQHVSKELHLSYLKSVLNIRNKEFIETYKSIPKYSNRIKKISFYPKNETLSITKLDSFKKITTENLNLDYKISKKLIDSSKFESNKIYFRSLNTFITNYLDLYNNPKKIIDITTSYLKKESFQLEDGTYVILLTINPKYIEKFRKELDYSESILNARYINSTYLYNILIWPLNLFYEDY